MNKPTTARKPKAGGLAGVNLNITPAADPLARIAPAAPAAVETKVRLSVPLPEDLHSRLKIIAAHKKSKLEAILREVVADYVRREWADYIASHAGDE